MVGGRGVRLGRGFDRPRRRAVPRPRPAGRAPAGDARAPGAHRQHRPSSTWLEELVPELLRRERATHFDPARERVVGVTRLWYQDLLVREDASQPVDACRGRRASGRARSGTRASSLFRDDPAAATWLARYAFVKQAVPELDWPEIGESAFAELLGTDSARVGSKLEEVRQADKVAYLESRLAHPAQSRELAQSAPPSLQVPSGRQVKPAL